MINNMERYLIIGNYICWNFPKEKKKMKKICLAWCSNWKDKFLKKIDAMTDGAKYSLWNILFIRRKSFNHNYYIFMLVKSAQCQQILSILLTLSKYFTLQTLSIYCLVKSKNMNTSKCEHLSFKLMFHTQLCNILDLMQSLNSHTCKIICATHLLYFMQQSVPWQVFKTYASYNHYLTRFLDTYITNLSFMR